jgi:hypothetical protein
MPKQARRNSRPKQVKGRQRSRTMPLMAAREAVRSRKTRKKPASPGVAGSRSPVPDISLFGHHALDAAASTARCANACVSLPLRLARCTSPIELVREQARFALGIAADYGAFTSRALHLWLEITRGVPADASSARAGNDRNARRSSGEP